MKIKANSFSKIITPVLIILCVILTFMMYMQKRTKNYYKQAAKLPFYNVRPQEVADGTYRGKIYTQFLHVQLDVSVANGHLTKIEIIENEGSVGKRVEPILDEMIAQNDSVVTAIKGEELASIVFVACVDDALFKGLSQARQIELQKSDEKK